mgnify:CR=1 FL=1
MKEILISDNYEQMLDWLGYKFDYEYIQEGFIFQTRSGLEIKVYQLLKVRNDNN